MLLLLFNQGLLSPITPTLYFRETWFPALVSIIQGVCPEVTVIVRSHSFNRSNWGNLVERGQLQPPWVIIQPHQSQQEDWGRDNITWRQPVSIYYVASTVAGSAGAPLASGYDAGEFALGRGLDIATSCIGYTGSGFQMLNTNAEVSIDEWSLPNQVMYSLQAPLIVAEVKASLLWGASNLAGDLWST